MAENRRRTARQAPIAQQARPRAEGAHNRPRPIVRTRGPNVAGEKAREHLLRTAISMFARHGYAGVSTRELAKKAGLNQAAVYYYFHTKRVIYIEAVVRCFNEVSAERLRALTDAERLPATGLEDVLRAFIEPHVRYVTRKEGQDYLRIFNTFSSTPEDILVELYKNHFGPVRERFIGAIHSLEPGIEADALRRFFGVIANMIVAALFDHGYKATTGRDPHSIDADGFIQAIVAYNAAGIRALRNIPRLEKTPSRTKENLAPVKRRREHPV